MKDATQAMVSALLVLTNDPKIRMWLGDNDPKALSQAQEALALAYGQASGIRELFHGHRPEPQNATIERVKQLRDHWLGLDAEDPLILEVFHELAQALTAVLEQE
jgi:hypothetical protein